ncbi:hypothetical protein GG344DRAFT_84409 [Lentinula edodes]|nr:hypothetical protein GG344DRAFT_84409 [Lentinula edodes]
MASSSSQTRTAPSSILLPSSELEAQDLLAGIKSPLTLPLFFKSLEYQRLLNREYIPPILSTQDSPDYDDSSAFPAFSYPQSLVPFCFPPDSCPLSVASGLDLFCSTQMVIRSLQALVEAPSSDEGYALFEETAPFLIYLCDFWIGRANCPLFAEHILLTAGFLSQGLPTFLRESLEKQWGTLWLRSQETLNFESFPAIPIPFSLCFWEGSAIMHLVSSEDLDPFASLRGKGPTVKVSKPVSSSSVLDGVTPSCVLKASVASPRLIRQNRELEDLKADTSSFLSSPCPVPPQGSDNELLSGFLSWDVPNPSLVKASAAKVGPKAKTTVKVVEGKSRQTVVMEDDSTYNEVELEDEDKDKEESIAPPSKRLKMNSSIPGNSFLVPFHLIYSFD